MKIEDILRFLFKQVDYFCMVSLYTLKNIITLDFRNPIIMFMKNTFIILVLFLFLTSSISGQTLNELISSVSKERVIQKMKEFSGEVTTTISDTEVVIEHRVSSTGNDLAADYLIERLSLPNIVVSDIAFGNKGRNIVGIQLGTVNPDQIYVICAHYDSVAEHGADDNASGTVAVLEAATILSGYNMENTIIYALWDEEEIGLLGAKDYAEDAKQNNDNILGVLNMDMMAYDSNNDHKFDIDVRNVADSYEMRDDLIDLYTSLELDLTHNVVDPGTTASDHAAFWNQGYSAVLFGEAWSDNDVTPGYHTNNDRLSLLNEDYYIEMIKLTLAYTADKGVLLSSAVTQSLQNKVEISPNPGRDFLKISFADNLIDNFIIYDSMGKLIVADRLAPRAHLINISGLNPTSYFLQLKKDNQTIVQKIFIKQ
jgi:hypothetical protein